MACSKSLIKSPPQVFALFLNEFSEFEIEFRNKLPLKMPSSLRRTADVWRVKRRPPFASQPSLVMDNVLLGSGVVHVHWFFRLGRFWLCWWCCTQSWFWRILHWSEKILYQSSFLMARTFRNNLPCLQTRWLWG